MSKFRVNDTFALESRQLFVLAGSIVEGQIRAGMIVNVPLNSSLLISGAIHSIEFARRTDGREDVCLCITYEDSDELRVWNALNVQDEVLDVVPFNSNGSAGVLFRRREMDFSSKVAPLRREYGSLFTSISEALFKADPGHLNYDVNTDEYDPEVATIIPRLSSARSAEDVETILKEELLRWFCDIGVSTACVR